MSSIQHYPIYNIPRYTHRSTPSSYHTKHSTFPILVKLLSAGSFHYPLRTSTSRKSSLNLPHRQPTLLTLKAIITPQEIFHLHTSFDLLNLIRSFHLLVAIAMDSRVRCGSLRLCGTRSSSLFFSSCGQTSSESAACACWLWVEGRRDTRRCTGWCYRGV
jgi:hypothetical protein